MNEAPIFTAPVTLTDHNRSYRYAISVSDPDSDPVTITVDSKPAWMDYDSDSLLLSGIAGWDNLGFHGVVITASDSDETVHQNFNVNVVIGEIVCNQDFGDPAQSLFVMPYAPGKTQFMIQSYCPPNPTWGHTNWCAIVTVWVDGWEPIQLVRELRKRKINTSAQVRSDAVLHYDESGATGALRISPHYYNNEEEIETVVEAVTELVALKK